MRRKTISDASPNALRHEYFRGLIILGGARTLGTNIDVNVKGYVGQEEGHVRNRLGQYELGHVGYVGYLFFLTLTCARSAPMGA